MLATQIKSDATKKPSSQFGVCANDKKMERDTACLYLHSKKFVDVRREVIKLY